MDERTLVSNETETSVLPNVKACKLMNDSAYPKAQTNRQ